MSSLNRCEFIGNLTRDPEVQYTQSGVAYAKFSIAVNEKWKNKDGGKEESVTFVDCTAWKKLAEIIGEYLRKGSKVFVAGKYKVNIVEKEGEKKYYTGITVFEMVMLDRKGEGPAQGVAPAEKTTKTEDDLPF